MRSFLLIIIIVMGFFGCRAQKNLRNDDIDIDRIIVVKGITFWFDVYDPVSFTLNFSNDTLKIIFYTHNLNSDKVVVKEYTSSDKSTLYLFKELNLNYYKSCEMQSDYTCVGLDGSETWIQFKKDEETLIRKYWSPEDQLNTELGVNLTKFQREISDNLNINQLKEGFISALKKGKYWNYGASQLKK